MNKKEANKILEQRIKDYEPIKELKKFIDDSEEKHRQTMYYLKYILWTMEEEYQKKMPIHFKFDPDELNRKYFDEEEK